MEPRLEPHADPVESDSPSWMHETTLPHAAVALPAGVATAATVASLEMTEAPEHDQAVEPEPSLTAHEDYSHAANDAPTEGITNQPAPRIDDWLDRAFADLAEPVPSIAATATERTEPVVTHAPPTQHHDDHGEVHAGDHMQTAHA